MTKKPLKLLAMLTLIGIPQSINEGYSPKLEKLENIKAIEIEERNRINSRYHLIELNENINAVERKKEFLLMRLNENISDSTIKIDYTNKLKETEKKLRKYYSKKDSIYKSINK